MKMKPPCAICDEPSYMRLLCSAHYERARRLGVLDQIAPRQKQKRPDVAMRMKQEWADPAQRAERIANQRAGWSRRKERLHEQS